MPGFVPCVTWVKKGVAKGTPEKVQATQEDLERLIKEAKEDLGEWEDVEDDDGDEDNDDIADETMQTTDDAEADAKENVIGEGAVGGEGTKKRKKKKKKVEKSPDEDDEDDDVGDIEEKYGLDDYDDEDEEEVTNLWGGIKGLTYYSNNKEDPFITIKDDDEDSDTENFLIKPTDNLVVVPRVKADCNLLEVFVYNEDEVNFYIHHDLLLPSFPLAVEWMNFDLSSDKPGNFVAIGSMEPTIDIWDLDVVESIEPDFTLGTKISKKKSKKKGVVGGHTDAVLDLSWNVHSRNVLASGSADYTIALWDMSQGKVVTSLKQHKEKVQTIEWHPFEAQTLVSGSFDHTTKVFDCRNPNESHKSWKLNGEIERVKWNHFSPYYYLASTDKGYIYYIDVRTEKPVFTLGAHDKAVTGLSFSSQVPGLLVTTSADQHLKVWDIQRNKPECVQDSKLSLGELQCVSSCPDAPYVFAIGGESDLKVWDIRENASVRKHFQGRSVLSLSVGGSGDGKDSTNDEIDSVAMDTLNISAMSSSGASTKTSVGQSQTEKKKRKKKKNKK